MFGLPLVRPRSRDGANLNSVRTFVVVKTLFERGPMAVGRSCVLVAVGVSLDPTEYRLRLRCIHNKLLAFTCLELQNSVHKGGAGARARGDRRKFK